ncbi:MAG: aminodeoxychorismate synthase component I [Odoribacter sp.]
MKAEMVRQEMNRCGARGKPFLFGVDFEMEHGFFVENPMDDCQIPFVAGRVTNVHELPEASVRPVPRLDIVNPDAPAYWEQFEKVRSGLLRGDSFLLNLTAKTTISTNLSLEQIFRYSHARYKLLLPDRLVCFSPESFVRINGDEILSYPMKGTIDATLPEAATLLLENYKEECEHYTIVDLIRNDLNRVADGVRVKRFRYVEKIHTLHGEILQTSSEIAGRLPSGYRSTIGDLIFKLLPAGSISGAPKPSTLALIRKAEEQPRGYYSGVFGYFDGQNLDSAVMIRYIEKEGNRYFFRSGGGITINSKVEEEYQEMLEKIYLSIPIKR